MGYLDSFFEDFSNGVSQPLLFDAEGNNLEGVNKHPFTSNVLKSNNNQ